MPGGITAAVDMARPVPAIATPAPDWILPLRDVEQWLRNAQAGEKLLYGQALRMVRGETSEMLGGAQKSGDVLLFQPRSSDGQRFDFIAVKRLTDRARQMAGRTADPAMRVIFRRLQRAAEIGERCPSDRMLGSLTGLRIPQVKWRIRKLEAGGKITTRTVWTPRDPRFRIVTIAATGAETASPGGMQ